MRNLIPVLMLVMSVAAISFNSPSKYICSEPWDVILHGPEKQNAFEQLQAAVKGKLTLTIDASGAIAYTQNKDEMGRLIKMNRGAKKLVRAIDDHTINVNVFASVKKVTSTKGLLLGGAFMGNEVTKKMVTTKGERSNAPLVETMQEVNVNNLKKISEYYGKPGADMLHEIIESYIGGKNSQRSGVSALPKKNRKYIRAHRASTKQSGPIYSRIIQFGNQTSMELVDTTKFYTVEYFIKKNDGPELLIREVPKDETIPPLPL